jgi:hypothetical protein
MTLKGKRTLIFAALLIIAGVVETKWALLQPYLAPDTYGIGLIVIGVIVACLRSITSTALFQEWLGSGEEKT